MIKAKVEMPLYHRERPFFKWALQGQEKSITPTAATIKLSSTTAQCAVCTVAFPCGCYKKGKIFINYHCYLTAHCALFFTTREEGVVGLELAGYDFNIEVSAHQIDQLNKI